MSIRNETLKTLVQHILKLDLGHPTRVGVDGITASGKSTFAKELANILREQGRTVIASSLDGFHNPRAHRYKRGRSSPEGYYWDAYNYNAIVEHLLKPLGNNGTRKYRTQFFDLEQDQPLELEAETASPNSILVVDGSFALRKELSPYWNVGIYLKVDFKIAEDRASVRDANDFGSVEVARSTTRDRYHGAHRIHIEIGKPYDSATYVIDNDNPIAATIISHKCEL